MAILNDIPWSFNTLKMEKLKPIPAQTNYTVKQLEKGAWEGDMIRWALKAKKEYKALQKEKENLSKLLDLANAIISPALEILPETYDDEINAYLEAKR